MGRKSPGGGVYGGNDVGGVDGWGGAADNGILLDEDAYGGVREDGDEGVPLQSQNPCVEGGARSRAESGEVVPDPFLNSLKVVH